jgi:hypothetical protein
MRPLSTFALEIQRGEDHEPSLPLSCSRPRLPMLTGF